MNAPIHQQRPAANRRKLLTLTAVGCLLLGWGLYFKTREPAAPPAAPRIAETRKPAPPPPPPSAETPPTDHPVLASTANLLAADGDTATDLEILTVVLTDYRRALGENPVGENEEITLCLLGGNAKHLRFLPAGHRAIDRSGRLCDRWGTPFFFHAISSHQMRIRSAGPDREHGTPDDLTGPESGR